MDFWVPVVFGTFKLLVLGTCMFLGIKSHYDGAKKEKEKQKEKETGAERESASTSVRSQGTGA
ncbi:hypothetical protein [Bordetella genomosp. 13]|uniref:hypothetical protein n=1 Tax=Bordetella genomosp. 13 TaxID=463040 RepID=UPI0011A0D5F1|nr:hypothetical protein [Bordetella genomosp. 13]